MGDALCAGGHDVKTMTPRPRKASMTPRQFRGIIAGVKQGEAAERLGVSRQTVVRWLSGFTRINAANANLIRLTFKSHT